MSSAYIMVVLGIILAKSIGFYRDMAFAGVFGTGVQADIYFQVFGLVNLIFTGIGVALSTLVIKNINKAENAGHEKAYASQFLRKSFFYLLIVSVLMALLAKPIVNIILPNLSAKDLQLAVQMMYVMLPSLVFVVIAYIISGLLQNERVYFVTAIMSLPFNAVIILALLVPEVSIFTVGIVTTIGWFLHIVILLPSFYKKGYSLLKKSGGSISQGKNLEILWIFISNMMFQLCFYTDRAFVSGDAGMAATFNYASNLFITISSVFVVAMSTVVFPSISKNYEEGNIDYVNELLRYIITIMVAIFLPFLLVVGFFGTDIIRLVYERGSFSSDSTLAVSSILVVYSFGILGYVSQELFNKILYLAGKYRYCVIGTISVIALNLLCNLLIVHFVPETTFAGTGLSVTAFLIACVTTLLLTCYAVLIAIGIRKVVGAYWKKDLLLDIGKISISGILASLAYWCFNSFMPEFTHGYLTFTVPLCGCGAVYIISLYATGVLARLIKKDRKG
ncbi:MAG: hypothetical protein IJ285_04990 [Clostridia bacterium]|nr:hypothetical protein [Clostridia bacterium]